MTSACSYRQNDLQIDRMESPHEHQQNLLLSRIITNVEINVQNMNIELVAQMFKNYQSNVLFHLEATDNLKEPL
ncbi:hypothetical protein DL767_003730 [Monosporascus sp. MG133]|nr:hypothetical protein DL767_003730 [Monosporascus sp. MG133]